MSKLTQASIRAALAKPGRYRDDDGLLLYVSKPGLASWVCRYQKNGKRRDFGLGSLKTVGLSEARKKARATKDDPAMTRSWLRTRDDVSAARSGSVVIQSMPGDDRL